MGLLTPWFSLTFIQTWLWLGKGWNRAGLIAGLWLFRIGPFVLAIR